LFAELFILNIINESLVLVFALSDNTVVSNHRPANACAPYCMMCVASIVVQCV